MTKEQVVTVLVVDEERPQRSQAFLFKISKRGRKYLYGSYGYLEDGEIKFHSYETRLDPNERGVHVIEGVRLDVLRVMQEFQKELWEYREKLEDARRRIEAEAKGVYLKVFRELWEKWREENPEPSVKEILEERLGGIVGILRAEVIQA